MPTCRTITFISLWLLLITALEGSVIVRAIPTNGERVELGEFDSYVHFTAMATNLSSETAILSMSGIPDVATSSGKGFSNFTQMLSKDSDGVSRISGSETRKTVIASDSENSNGRIWFSGWGKQEGISFNYEVDSVSGMLFVYAGGYSTECGQASLSVDFSNGDSAKASYSAAGKGLWGARFEIIWHGREPGDQVRIQFENIPNKNSGSSGLVAVGAQKGTQNYQLGVADTFKQEAEGISFFALESFHRIRSIVAPEATTATPSTRFVENHIEVSTDTWVYQFSPSGRQIFKATSNSKMMAPTLQNSLGATPSSWKRHELEHNLEAKTKALAREAFGISYQSNAEVIVKRELILSSTTSRNDRNHFLGRTCVLLKDPNSRSSTIIMYTAEGQPIRLETTAQNESAQHNKELLRKGVAMALITGLQPQEPALRLSTFYAPTEHRFHVSSLSFHGENFLNPSDQANPYEPDHFDLRHSDLVDTDAYVKSSDYKMWCYRWWELYGGSNGIRGNWNSEQQTWGRSNISTDGPHNLEKYTLAGRQPSETRLHRYSDDSVAEVPFDTGAQLSTKFYEDLEASHVSVITTHMGTIDDTFKFQQKQDIWLKLHTRKDPGLGSGNLRHLFLQGCSSMNYLVESDHDFNNLFSDWINDHVAAGIRTISGFDGGATFCDRNGWRYFGRYNKGDSLTDSFFLGDLDETHENNPLTIAYGPTQEAAFKTLVDGRFETEATIATWAVVSIWQDYEL